MAIGNDWLRIRLESVDIELKFIWLIKLGVLFHFLLQLILLILLQLNVHLLKQSIELLHLLLDQLSVIDFLFSLESLHKLLIDILDYHLLANLAIIEFLNVFGGFHSRLNELLHISENILNQSLEMERIIDSITLDSFVLVWIDQKLTDDVFQVIFRIQVYFMQILECLFDISASLFQYRLFFFTNIEMADLVAIRKKCFIVFFERNEVLVQRILVVLF